MQITSEHYYEKTTSAEKKPTALKLFFTHCMLFRGSNVVYRLLGVLAWINTGIAAYLFYSLISRFEI